MLMAAFWQSIRSGMAAIVWTISFLSLVRADWVGEG